MNVYLELILVTRKGNPPPENKFFNTVRRLLFLVFGIKQGIIESGDYRNSFVAGTGTK
jgi:hypothetical protein